MLKIQKLTLWIIRVTMGHGVLEKSFPSLSDRRSIDPSTVSSTFDMDQLWKIRRHQCKERPKISTNCKV